MTEVFQTPMELVEFKNSNLTCLVKMKECFEGVIL